MRRFLAPVAAACAACALAAPLWATAPAVSGGEVLALGVTGGEVPVPTVTGDEESALGADHVFGGVEHGVSGQEERGGETSEDARLDGDPVQTPFSSWTYVDRAFPDQAYDGTETADVGTGGLEWDHSYTRRALFRFPVELGDEAVVDSVALSTQVTWSYDCVGEAHMQLHRIDPFGDGATWNDQPTAHALLDTRNVKGGRTECSVDGSVEFDVTEAYRRALADGESHLHLRLSERDEAGSTAWRRFDVQDDPPVLVVDQGTPSTEPTASGDSVTSDGLRYRTIAGESAKTSVGQPVEGRALLDRDTSEAAVTVSAPLLGGKGRTRSVRWERAVDPSASGHRRRGGEAIPRARGPPTGGRSTPPVRRSQGVGDDDGTLTLPMRPSTGRRHTSGSARTFGPVAFEASRWARSSVAIVGAAPAMVMVETHGRGTVPRPREKGVRSDTGEHPYGVGRWNTAVRRPRWSGPVRVRGHHTGGFRTARGTRGYPPCHSQ